MTRLLMLALALVMTGCASQKLTHSYQGDVRLRTLAVNIAPLRDPEEAMSGSLKKITEIQRIIQSIEEVMDTEGQEKLMADLRIFEKTLVAGIRNASGVPVVIPADSDIEITWGDQQEISEIRYLYPFEKDDYLELYATVSYPSMSTSQLGARELNAERITVTPKLDVQIEGYTRKDKLFWREYVGYESNKEYVLSNQYVLGMSTSKIEDGNIFLLPLAEGVEKALKKKLSKR